MQHQKSPDTVTRCVSRSTQAAVIKYRRLGRWLKQQVYFLIILEAGKPKIKVLTNCVPGESSLPDLYTASFLCVFTWWRESKQAFGIFFS